jgi:diguanylate cyclase (GGDEF)-like protein/PAS domain S-box-containing protein
MEDTQNSYAAWVEILPVPYQSLDAAGHFLMVNEAWLALFCCTREEVIGRFFGDFMEESSRNVLGVTFADFKREGFVSSPIFEARRKNTGERLLLTVNGRVERDEHGEFARTHCILTDVTDKVAAEEKLRIAASVFANAQEGIAITDPGGFIADVNPAFTRITGYTRDEVLGRTPRMLRSGHQDAAFYQQMWASLHETGHWRGEVWNRHKAGEVYPELLSITAVKDQASQISHYIGTFFDITHLKEREAHLERIAHYDPLTGLPNRRLLADRLRQALGQTRRMGKMAAVCVLDLDKFKPINDALGHEAGDAVLIEVSRRLLGCVRDFDTVARFGGDEFVLLLINLDWVEDCDRIVMRLLTEISGPIDTQGQTVAVSASIGVALFPQDHTEPESLLKQADQAMYLAKQAGRNGYRLFRPEHDRLVREYRRLIEDLTVALAKDQFILHYQPLLHLKSGQIRGVEALIRWRHPERGLLAPAEFLYAIGHANLDVPLGHWVMNTALRQRAKWKAAGLDWPVSINLSPRSLLDGGFIAYLSALLAHEPTLRGADLEIDVLDHASLLNKNNEAAGAAIRACQALGVRIALDNVGAEHSSVASFRRLPTNTLKIDPQFVRDVCEEAEDKAIVEDIVRMGRGFNREVIAKGVEHAEQAAQLIALGCEIAQGYAIAKPMPAESLLNWLANRPQPLFE